MWNLVFYCKISCKKNQDTLFKTIFDVCTLLIYSVCHLTLLLQRTIFKYLFVNIVL